MLIETRHDIDEREVWESVWGNDGQGFAYWTSMVRDLDGGDFHYYLNTDADFSEWIANPHDFRVWTIDGTEHVVTVYALCKAYADLLMSRATHCGGHPLIGDPDSCTEDSIIQHAIFGELVYG